MTIRAYNNWPEYDDDLANKAYVDTKVESIEISGGSDTSLTKRVESLESSTKNLNISVGNKLDKTTYDSFISEQYNPLSKNVENKIESYYQSEDPSSTWTSNIEKETHVGDIWYNTETQKTLVYYKDTSTSPTIFYWQWQNVPIELLNNINGKATFFSGSEAPSNYKIGDYWIIPLDIYTNSFTISSDNGHHVGEEFTLGEYNFIVESVDDNGKILTVESYIPENSSYDLSNALSDNNIELIITSTPKFDLPDGANGGDIYKAIDTNSSYISDDWTPRSQSINLEQANSMFIDNDEYNNKSIALYDTVTSDIKKLDNAIALEIKHTNGLINSANSNISNNTNLINNSLASINSRFELIENKITATVAKAGGNNLLKNSVGFRGTQYWDIENNKIKHYYNTKKNELITISFKYKKNKPNLSTVTLNGSSTNFKVILNTNTESDEWIDMIYSYESSINTPYIEFSSIFTAIQDNDAEVNGISGSKLIFEDGLIITDLMISYGDKQVWSPYFDEVYGKSHSLDENGLNLLDLSSGNKSHLDTNSLDFINSDNKIVAYFAKTESMTDNMIFNNSYKIGGITTVKLDDNNILEY